MKNKKRLANWILFFVLSGAFCAGARPAVRFLEELIAEGEKSGTTHLAAVILYGMAAIVLLTSVLGFLAVARGPVAGTSVLILFAAAICGTALYLAVRDAPGPTEEAPGTPRPTVTPPEVVISFTPKINRNPENGEVFYRRYGNESGLAIFENNSTSDIYFRMFDRHGILVLIFYVRAGEICRMPVPTGTYEFRCVTGRAWEGEETYFGDKSRFRTLPGQYVFYNDSPITIELTPGLPEMEDIKIKEFEEFTNY